MTDRIIVGANGRKYIVTEPTCKQDLQVEQSVSKAEQLAHKLDFEYADNGAGYNTEWTKGLQEAATLLRAQDALLRSQAAEIEADNRNLEQLSDEVNALRTELEAKNGQVSDLIAVADALSDTVEELRQELEAEHTLIAGYSLLFDEVTSERDAARKDAARYRFAQSKYWVTKVYSNGDTELMYDNDIDAAMGATK